LSKDFAEDELVELVIEIGAEDFTEEDDFFEITTGANEFNQIVDILKEKNIEYINAEMSLRAETLINLDQEMSEKVLNIMEFMDDLDDVQEVHTNAELAENFEVEN
jgi:transcriptional/translational regulatory protein YebC/TACO1